MTNVLILRKYLIIINVNCICYNRDDVPWWEKKKIKNRREERKKKKMINYVYHVAKMKDKKKITNRSVS